MEEAVELNPSYVKKMNVAPEDELVQSQKLPSNFVWFNIQTEIGYLLPLRISILWKVSYFYIFYAEIVIVAEILQFV